VCCRTDGSAGKDQAEEPFVEVRRRAAIHWFVLPAGISICTARTSNPYTLPFTGNRMKEPERRPSVPRYSAVAAAASRSQG
jgi:hypothetical protein